MSAFEPRTLRQRPEGQREATAVDAPRPRRPRAVVEEEKAQKEKEKQEKVAKRKEAIEKAAAIEDKIHRAGIARKGEGANPEMDSTLPPRQHHRRPTPELAPEEPVTADVDRELSCSSRTFTHLSSAHFSKDSGSAYEKEVESEDSDSDMDMALDPSEDEDTTKKGSKPKKNKMAARHAVADLRNSSDAKRKPADADQKQKYLSFPFPRCFYLLHLATVTTRNR